MIPAFLIGLTGSLHCVGMCGPIAMAAPVGKNNKWLGLSIYHISRIFSYAALGFLFGGLGYSFSAAGLQKWVAILGGTLLLSMVWLPGLASKINSGLSFPTLKIAMAKQLKKNRLSALSVLGMLNGLLPCSMVYFALTGAIITGEPILGALFMVAFGLGTYPTMVIFGFLGNRIPSNLRQNLIRFQPYLLTIIALWLILRGLNLGIPFLSPESNLIISPTQHCD
jgi:sulfite exporter TauE/SafE